MVIVIHPPSIHNVSRFGQAQEQFAVEALIPQLAVEALDVPVLPWAALSLPKTLSGAKIEENRVSEL